MPHTEGSLYGPQPRPTQTECNVNVPQFISQDEQYWLDVLLKSDTGQGLSMDLLLKAIRECGRKKDFRDLESSDIFVKYWDLHEHEQLQEQQTEKRNMELAIEQSQLELRKTDSPDIQKAIKASLEDNSNNRTPYEQSLPPLREMLNASIGTTGLFNIGNSCWFNTGIQFLYSLPAFRRVLYTAEINPFIGPAQEIVSQLRHLFVTMQLTNKKYIDPSQAVSAVADYDQKMRGPGERTILGSQQDAFEMLIRLIEWIEQGLNKEQKTPLIKSFLTPMENQGMPGTSTEAMSGFEAACPDEPMGTTGDVAMHRAVSMRSVNDFTQTPSSQPFSTNNRKSPLAPFFHAMSVQIRGFDEMKLASSLPMWTLDVHRKNLNAALDAEMLPEDGSCCIFYEELPAVLMFCVGRFSFRNNSTQKLHDKFYSPQKVYMDRFLLRNRVPVQNILKQRDNLRKRQAIVKAQLHRMLHYGGDGVPPRDLIDSMERVYAFAFGEPYGRPMSSSLFDANDMDLEVVPQEISHAEQKLRAQLNLHQCPDPTCNDAVTEPQILRNEFADRSRFREAIAQLYKTREQLNSELKAINFELASLFDEPFLKQEAYRLHYAIIHTGQASSGHYFAFTPDKNGEVDDWLKLNDNKIESIKYSEVEKACVGSGDRHASSAYVYMYVKESATWLFESNVDDCIPNYLKQQVEHENLDFLELVHREAKCEIASMIGLDSDRPMGALSCIVEDPERLSSMIYEELDSFPVSDVELFQQVTENYSKAFDCHTRTDFDALMRARFSEYYNKCAKIIIKSMYDQLPLGVDSAEQMDSQVFQLAMSNWEASSRDAIVHSDPLIDMLEFVRRLGVRIKAKTLQYFVLQILEFHDGCSERMMKLVFGAREEFLQNSFHIGYKMQFNAVFVRWVSGAALLECLHRSVCMTSSESFLDHPPEDATAERKQQYFMELKRCVHNASQATILFTCLQKQPFGSVFSQEKYQNAFASVLPLELIQNAFFHISVHCFCRMTYLMLHGQHKFGGWEELVDEFVYVFSLVLDWQAQKDYCAGIVYDTILNLGNTHSDMMVDDLKEYFYSIRKKLRFARANCNNIDLRISDLDLSDVQSILTSLREALHKSLADQPKFYTELASELVVSLHR